jgi:hypothetical protein
MMRHALALAGALFYARFGTGEGMPMVSLRNWADLCSACSLRCCSSFKALHSEERPPGAQPGGGEATHWLVPRRETAGVEGNGRASRKTALCMRLTGAHGGITLKPFKHALKHLGRERVLPGPGCARSFMAVAKARWAPPGFYTHAVRNHVLKDRQEVLHYLRLGVTGVCTQPDDKVRVEIGTDAGKATAGRAASMSLRRRLQQEPAVCELRTGLPAAGNTARWPRWRCRSGSCSAPTLGQPAAWQRWATGPRPE